MKTKKKLTVMLAELSTASHGFSQWMEFAQCSLSLTLRNNNKIPNKDFKVRFIEVNIFFQWVTKKLFRWSLDLRHSSFFSLENIQLSSDCSLTPFSSSRLLQDKFPSKMNPKWTERKPTHACTQARVPIIPQYQAGGCVQRRQSWPKCPKVPFSRR